MKDIHEVLRLKEQQFERLRQEIDALRSAIRIMNEVDYAAASPAVTAPVAGRGNGAPVASVPANGGHLTAAPVKNFP